MNLEETYRSRLAGVRKYLTDKGLDGALFTSYENRRYYCGFTGSNGYLTPTNNATRAQVAAILHRFVENVAKTTK